MIAGDRIKLIKPMGCFTKVGEICEVANVSEDGIITFVFRDGLLFGCMSHDEYQKYFELVEEKPRNKWSNWMCRLIECFDFYYDDPIDVEVEYRHNGKTVQIRSKDGIKSEATCSKCDVFNLNKGFSLARKRFVIKYLERQLTDYIRTLNT